MTLDKAYALLNFYVNKYQGAYFTPAELDLVVDRAQKTLFNSYYVRYSASQRLDDALAPFKQDLQFSNVDTPNGVLTTPANYLNLLALNTVVIGSDSVARPRPVQILSEDDLVTRLNSQVNPVTVNDPVGVIKSGAVPPTTPRIQLYPAQPQAGSMTYLRQPVSPFFSYSVISGRVIVYDSVNSVQLEWSDKDVVVILLLALSTLGINISEQDIMQYSEMKVQANFNTNMKQ